MPNLLTPEQRLNPPDSLSTALYSVANSVDFATRVAKIIARKTEKPAYVGCSVSFTGAVVEEEIEGVRTAIDTIMSELEMIDDLPKTNGI
ncbi:hypothetical protein MMC14_000466 [Varicellaria rhodocarpa]|nr:hypothetical protein [Varicellaria rhodocarpa]